MKLLIDAGNRRVKWATARGTGPDAQLDLGRAVTISAALESELSAAWAALDRPAAVWASCVAGRAVADAVTSAAARAWGLRAVFIEARARYAGVVNSYPRPAALGGDRWAALVGARWLRPGRATVVVDAGSAVTVDALDAAGVFRGGVILPGARAMTDALGRQTANLGGGGDGDGDGGGIHPRHPRSPHLRHPRSLLSGGGDGTGDDGGDSDSDSDSDTITRDTVTALATDTVAAVVAGAWLAVAGGVDRALAAQLAAMSGDGDGAGDGDAAGAGDGDGAVAGASAGADAAPVLITGGDASRLAPLLAVPVERAPALVLRGLAVLAAAS